MNGLDQLLRLQKWAIDEKRRQAADLMALIERLQNDIAKLDEDVSREIEIALVVTDSQLNIVAEGPVLVLHQRRTPHPLLRLALNNRKMVAVLSLAGLGAALALGMVVEAVTR